VSRKWLDRTILGALFAVAAAGVSGATLAVSGHSPSDALHYLYAVVALVTLPLARFWGGRLAAPRPGRMLLAGLIFTGVTLRLFQTGA
jgi:hypothetical protein